MLRIVPHTAPRVGRSYEHFPDGFELHLLRQAGKEGVFSDTGYGGRPFDTWRFERLCVITQSVDHFLLRDRKGDIRLHGKGNFKTPWRKAGQPRHLIDVVDSDQ